MAQSAGAEVLKSRMLAALRRSSIMGGGMGPYRLNGRIVTYDGAGKNPVEGTLEILRSNDAVRISVAFPNAVQTVISTRSGSFQTPNVTLPYYAARMVRVLQEPVAFSGFEPVQVIPGRAAESGAELSCLALTPPRTASLSKLAGPQYEACLQPPHDDLRLVVEGDEHYLRDDVAAFEDHDPARHLSLQLGGVTVAEIFVVSLEPAHLTDTDFQVTNGMKAAAMQPARIPGSVVAGRVLKHEEPKYPKSLLKARLQGVVVVHAIISEDGHIQDLDIISSPDPQLSEASMKAIRKWTYEPYLLDGKPAKVDTTISVRFAFGSQ